MLRQRIAKGAAWVGIATILVAGFEGFARKPYIDWVGRGHPVTWCYGETRADGPVPPMSKLFTKAECTASLQEKLTNVYDPAVRKCIHVPLPPHREAALVSAAYNLGPGAICHGPIARNLNAGDIVAGCRAILVYDHARGRRLPGLTKRRVIEYKMCLRND